MEQIGIEKLKKDDITSYIYSLFPKNIYHGYDLFTNPKIFDGESHVSAHQNFNIKGADGYSIDYIHIESEFQLRINIYGIGQDFTSERELFIAYKLSIFFHCKTIVNAPDEYLQENYSLHNPFISFIFKNGEIFEADDSDSDCADNTGTGNMVKITEKINFPIYDFDENGKIIKDRIINI